MSYETDPRWIEANKRWLEPRRTDESPTEHYTRGVQAVYDKFQIESEYENGAA